MTACIHHGNPGSYKSFALVQRVIIKALVEGRVVVTNVRGFSIDKVIKHMAVTLHPDSKLIYVEPSIEGYDHIARFFHWAPAGSLIVIDEGQRVYSRSERNFRHLDQDNDIPIAEINGMHLLDEKFNPVFRPHTLEVAIDQHRHFNWDIYFSTTNVAKMHKEVRETVEQAYRHKGSSGILPWKKNTWSEFRHDAESSGKSISHYSGSPKTYKADIRVFKTYSSTATGKAKDSTENISVFRDTKFRIMAFVFMAALANFVYKGFAYYDQNYSNNIESSEVVLQQNIEAGFSLPVENTTLRSSLRFSDDRLKVSTNFTRLIKAPFANYPVYYSALLNDVAYVSIDYPDLTSISLPVSELEVFGISLVSIHDYFLTLRYSDGLQVVAMSRPVDRTPYDLPERSRDDDQQDSFQPFTQPMQQDFINPLTATF